MKIVINALSARLGGGQTYLKNLLAHLPEQPELEILIYAPDSLSLPEDQRIRRLFTSWPTTNPVLRTIWEKVVLPHILAKEKADVLFCPGGVLTSRVPKGCKTVTMFRNMIPFDTDVLARIPIGLQKARNILLKRVMLNSMANADLTIFISDHARHLVEALIRVPNPVTIPHGISAAFRTHEKELQAPAWLPTGEYLLYVSRFDIYKHQLEVASAFAALPAYLTLRYKLLLVGEVNEGLARRVTDFARENGLGDQIRIIGPISYADLPAAYHHAKVNLFASSCENCPNILLEALGAGRPLLSSNVMPMPEFGGDAVAYFSPFDPCDIAKAMEKVLTDADYARQLASAAAQRSCGFDWESTARKTWAHISALLNKVSKR